MCDYLRYVTLLFIYAEALFDFEGWLEKKVLAWILYTVNNKGIAEKMRREHPAAQLFCNAHTPLVWLCLTFILLFYLV